MIIISIFMMLLNLSYSQDNTNYRSNKNKGLSNEERFDQIDSYLVKMSKQTNNSSTKKSIKKLEDIDKRLKKVEAFDLQEISKEVEKLKKANWSKTIKDVKEIKTKDLVELKKSIKSINEQTVVELKKEIDLLKFRVKTIEGIIQTLEAIGGATK